MKSHHTLLALLTSLFPVMAQRPSPDASSQLLSARDQYSASSGAARATLLRALDAARAQEGSATGKVRYDRDREAFESLGLLPASIPRDVLVFEQSMLLAATKLEDAFRAAIKTFKAASQNDLADQAKDDLRDILLEHEVLRHQDLRCQVDLAKASVAGKWAWDGPALVSEPGSRCALRLPLPQTTLGGYALVLELSRTNGESDLQVVFPTKGQKLARGLLSLGGGPGGVTSGLQSIDGKPVPDKDGYKDPHLFSNGEPVKITLRCIQGGVTVLLGTTEIASAPTDAAWTIPDGLRREFVDAGSVYLIASASASFRVSRIALRSLDVPATQAAQQAASVLLPANSTWAGDWQEAETRGGPCQVEVIERSDGAATIEAVLHNGARFLVMGTLKGKVFTVTRIVHKRAAKGGKRMDCSEFTGSGTITDKGFSLTFSCRTEVDKKSSKSMSVVLKCTRNP